MKRPHTHPLERKLPAMREAGAIQPDIVLASLTRDDLEPLIVDFISCEVGQNELRKARLMPSWRLKPSGAFSSAHCGGKT